MGEDLGDDFDQALDQELTGGGLDDGFAGDDGSQSVVNL